MICCYNVTTMFTENYLSPVHKVMQGLCIALICETRKFIIKYFSDLLTI